MTSLPAEVSGTVVTVGTFDGVHLGHREVFNRLRDKARASGRRSVLVTFDPHPLEVVNPTVAPRLLTVGDEKTEVLATCDLDYVVVLPFTRTLAAHTAEQFVKEILVDRIRMRELLIGHDHGFGRNRAGNVEVLRALTDRYGFALDVIEPVGIDERHPYSSSVIRRAIAGGDLTRAARDLGRDYSISGRVERGSGRGRTLGFRTLNLAPVSPRKLLPPEGVYAVRVATPRGAFGGMMNLGPRPTFNDPMPKVEAHLFDVEVDLYDALVRVELLGRMRDTRKFASADALTAQLALDEREARALLRQRS